MMSLPSVVEQLQVSTSIYNMCSLATSSDPFSYNQYKLHCHLVHIHDHPAVYALGCGI